MERLMILPLVALNSSRSHLIMSKNVLENLPIYLGIYQLEWFIIPKILSQSEKLVLFTVYVALSFSAKDIRDIIVRRRKKWNTFGKSYSK